MAGDAESADILVQIREIIEDEQRLERSRKDKDPSFNQDGPRSFAFRRIANLVLPPEDRIT